MISSHSRCKQTKCTF